MKRFRLDMMAALVALVLALAGCGGGGGGGSSSAGGGAAAITDPTLVTFESTSKTLGPLTGGTMSAAVAINSGGTIVGMSGNTAQQVRGVKWSVSLLDGSVTAPVELAPLAGFSYSSAYGLNDAGFIVGEAEDAGNTVTAVSWAAGTTIAVKLAPLAAGKNSAAYAVSASGKIVGEAVNSSDVIVPVYWTSSSANPVALPARTAGAAGAAYAIIDNDDGSAVIVGDSGDRAVRWRISASGSIGSAEDMGMLADHTRSIAMGVNKNGVMVGESEDASGTTHAAVFKDKTLLGIVIPGFDVVDLGIAGIKSSASAINDDSRIAGWANDAGGSSLTALWLATASPVSTVNTALSGSGGVGLAFGINAKSYVVGTKSDRGFVAIPR